VRDWDDDHHRNTTKHFFGKIFSKYVWYTPPSGHKGISAWAADGLLGVTEWQVGVNTVNEGKIESQCNAERLISPLVNRYTCFLKAGNSADKRRYNSTRLTCQGCE
jgi:hypothetical protein